MIDDDPSLPENLKLVQNGVPRFNASNYAKLSSMQPTVNRELAECLDSLEFHVQRFLSHSIGKYLWVVQSSGVSLHALTQVQLSSHIKRGTRDGAGVVVRRALFLEKT
ncbi:unnamed protein product [Ascophyllum nodosum]